MMNAPETINIEKYANALNNLIGVDSAYMTGDKDVDAIVEVIVAAKKLENMVKELTEENERLRFISAHVCVGDSITSEQMEELRMAHTLPGMHGDPVGEIGCCGIQRECLANTVREIQERLKEYIDDFYSSGEDALLDVPDLIGQIAKEMLEENNV
jgi:hypothetical protein